MIFINEVEEEADSINNIPTCVAVAFAHMIAEKRAYSTTVLLIEHLAESIKDPDEQ